MSGFHVRQLWPRHARAVFVSTLTLCACGQPESIQHTTYANDGVAALASTGHAYANPNLGKDTLLRPSSRGKQQQLQDKFGLELTNPRVRVLVEQRTVRFQITRIERQKSEVITISGTFDDPTHALLVDEDAAGGKHRIKGLAYCLASTEEQIDCSDMFVNIYFNHNGMLISSQFVTDPLSGEHVPGEGLGGAEEEATDGEYVAPRLPDNFLDGLIARIHTGITASHLT